MGDSRKKEVYFLLFVLLVGIFLLVKTVRFSWNDGAVTMKITQNRGAIATLDTPRKPLSTQKMNVKKIYFPQGRMLETPQYGKLGFSNNFFLDFRTYAQIKKKGIYLFDIRSDDGFRLKINGKTICAHPSNRPMRSTVCKVKLEPGRVGIALSYFQGGGPLGLEARVQGPGDKRSRFIGENTGNIVYEKSE